LDESTRNRIHRGNILTQLLKQPAWAPIASHRQAIIIYAGINWYLDNIPTEQIASYESWLYDFIESAYSDFDSNLENKPELSSENEDKIKQILKEFGESFGK
jgi:F-type H+-transporting ATPase subunit alpha